MFHAKVDAKARFGLGNKDKGFGWHTVNICKLS